MIQVLSPTLEPFFTPEDLSEDGPSFTDTQCEAAVDFYDANGFVIIRELIDKTACVNIKNAFNLTIKNFNGKLLRINGKQEVNAIDNMGYITNPLMSIQQYPNKKVQQYIEKTLLLLTDQKLIKFAEQLLEGSGLGLLTWNQFEANPQTIPHHDCYFWGKDLRFREVVGAWIALEDIKPGAGRLYVYPGSHKFDFKSYAESLHLHHDLLQPTGEQYQELIRKFLSSTHSVCVAPYLRPGDVLFWDARTIHGSLNTDTPQYSRASFTSHYSLNFGRFISDEAKRVKINNVSILYGNTSFRSFLHKNTPFLKRPYHAFKELFKF